MNALEKEWLLRAPSLKGKFVESIYFGGGTPSLLGADYLRSILNWIQRDVGFPTQTEITLEANPEHLTLSLMHAYKQCGVNRVSIGIQTLSNPLLKLLERTHDAQQAIDAVLLTHASGFENITIDLMYDLPNQTLDHWQETLNQVCKLPIKHLSLYNLVIEPHTAFFKHRNKLQQSLPDPETSLQMYEMAQSIFTQNQLLQYEISAFAYSGFQSRHNKGYWTARPFLGLGPSAFSYWDGARFRNIANLNRYAQQLEQGLFPIDFEEKLERIASLRELLAIRIRLTEGINLSSFQKEHGPLDEETLKTLHHLTEKGYLQKDSDFIKLTKQGILFYDSIAVELI